VSAYKPGQETPSTRLGVFFYQEYNIFKESKVMALILFATVILDKDYFIRKESTYENI
jgi:hypothetical protein